MRKINKIYDLEISDELLSSLSFILLKAKVKFSTKEQLEIIVYKFYNFAKNEIIFDNGIVITEELKAKIEEFKEIYNILPDPEGDFESWGLHCTFPKLAQNNSSSPFLEGDYIKKEDVEAAEDNKVLTPYRFAFKPKTGTDYCNIQLEGRKLTTGAIVKEIKYFGRQSFVDLDYWTLSIGKNSSNYIILYRKVYNTSGEVIKEDSLTFQSTTGLNTNEVRIHKVYGDGIEVECYTKAGLEVIIPENLESIDTSELNIDDIFYAREIILESRKEVSLEYIIGKTINGERYGFRYGLIKTYLGKTCAYDKNVLKFLTILSNESETEYTGYVSTYPLYATKMANGELGMWFLNTGDNTPVRVFKSANGEAWDELKSNISSSLPYTTDAIIVKSTALSYAGQEIVYTNYPVFYSLSGDNFSNLNTEYDDEGNIIDKENINPLALEADNSLKLYRNSDEDFTLDMIALGANFYFGKHKIEDSPKFPLIFRASDYTNNLNIAENKPDHLPANCVYCETTHLIDKLSFHNAKNYNSHSSMTYENSHLPRWLNSEAPEGEWWSKINDLDTPSIAENMYHNDLSIGYEFGHRAGFLHNFSKAELEIMRTFTCGTVYHDVRVIVYDSRETPMTTSATYRPKMYKACGSSSVGIARPYLVKELKYHRHPKVASACSTALNNFVCTKTETTFWCRNKGTNYGQYKNPGSDKTAFEGEHLKPIICLDANTKVIREPDQYGVFSLDLGIKEEVEIRRDFDIERNIIINKESLVDTKRDVIHEEVKENEMIRNIASSGEFTADTERIVVKKIVQDYDVIRKTIYNRFKEFSILRKSVIARDKYFQITRKVIEKEIVIADVCRKVNIVSILTTNTVRIVYGYLIKENNVIRDVLHGEDKKLDIIRNVKHTFDIDKEIDLNRNLISEYTRNNGILRRVVETKISQQDIARNVYVAEVIVSDVNRNINSNIDKEINIERKLRSLFIKDMDVKRDVVYYFRKIIDLLRDNLINIDWDYQIVRNKVKPFEYSFDIKRDILISSDKLFQATRNKVGLISNSQDITRNIVVNIEEEYQTIRCIAKHFDSNVDLERIILSNITKDADTLRGISGKLLLDVDLKRDIIEETLITFDTLINITENVNGEYDVKREKLINSIIELDTQRSILKSILNEVDSFRNIAVSTDLEASIKRDIVIDLIKEIDIRKEVLESVENNFDTIKNILENTLKDNDVIKNILVENNIESDMERCIVEQIEVEHDIERCINTNNHIIRDFTTLRNIESEPSYVSRENLDYYTVCLKEKIDAYINEAVEKRVKEILKQINKEG